MTFRQILLTLTAAIALLPASALAKNLTVKFQGTSLEAAMTEIRKQSGYEFVYKKNLLPKGAIITLSLHNATLEQVLNRIFNDENGLDYEIIDKSIVITKAAPTQGFYKRNVTGTVSDAQGEPLIGVTVFVEGTSTGASTDIDGQFSIPMEKGHNKLRFSYVGMKPVSVALRPKENFISVVMEEEPQLMSEIVVTGYQQLKRENATGAFQTVTAADMAQRYTGDITSNLEGQVPGLVSYDNGKGKSLTIRGTGTFQANSQPLVVVDGLPIEGGIETVNPYEVENITILKDAAAAAIYGARASNGVIVITTKRAREERLTVEINADVTVSRKSDYSYMGWANAAELIELETYNFNNMEASSDRTSWNSLLNGYKSNPVSISPVTRLLLQNKLGEISDASLDSQLKTLAGNDYFKEFQKAVEREKVQQQYNVAIRFNGKNMANSLVLNYENDNAGMAGASNNAFMLNYRGNMKFGKWVDLTLGLSLISERANGWSQSWEFANIYSYQPYLSMYNADGSRAWLETYTDPGHEAFSVARYGLKNPNFNVLDDMEQSEVRTRRTNIRPWFNARVNLLPGWSATAMFQYEDIYYKNDILDKKDSYKMRTMYNSYTAYDRKADAVLHHIPDGGMLTTSTSEGSFYTFRAQTDYNNLLADKHEIQAAAGFEYREQREKTYGNILMGYDDQTQTNNNGIINWGQLKDLQGTAGVLGYNNPMYGAPDASKFATTHILHRFYSLYATANYVYDSRYALSLSCRLDKTDLFGADPKFRGRPLWSAGASWNLHNEAFMHPYTWVNVLKLRASYGLTGNIAQNVSSLLTASIKNNFIYGDKYASLNTPPNDQLRWEKTATWNAGVDFSFWNSRLSGSFDFYHKKGSDLLTVTDLDPTTGWSQLTINNGKMVNTGVELQLNSPVIEQASRSDFGLDLGFNIAWNRNRVTKVDHLPESGHEALSIYTLHKGYPVNSLFSYDFAGMVDKDGIQYFSWRDHDGNVNTSSIYTELFTPDDIVYSGSLDPKVMGSFTPTIMWQGFQLSAMTAWYGGHVMRANVQDYTSEGSTLGYGHLISLNAVPASYLNYWHTGDRTKYPANGADGGSKVVGNPVYMNSNVVPADFFKIRNIVLSYNFNEAVCRKLRLDELRLRFQMNNVATWARNSLGIDPEANDPINGARSLKAPKSYTFSLFFSF